MRLRRFRRQYEQLSQFERGRIIGMMEVGWSARQVARQLGSSDCVVWKCWDQWIRETSFARRPGSGRPRQTSYREDRHIVRNARLQPTGSPAAIQALVAPSLGSLYFLEPYEVAWLKDVWDRGAHDVCCPLRPPIDASIWRGAGYEDGLQRNGTRSSLATNPDSISAVMTIVFACGDPVVNASILPLRDILVPQLCDGMGCHYLQYTVTPSIDPWHHMTAQWFVRYILQPHVLPLMQGV
ncbi:uncharacterized protein TNCV_536511 [Trichonephila clavipes]|nr:uncharacterized protein TNCV_536511 [Trichonephila clavipes]